MIEMEANLVVENSSTPKVLRMRRTVSFDYDEDEHGSFIDEMNRRRDIEEIFVKVKGEMFEIDRVQCHREGMRQELEPTRVTVEEKLLHLD